MDNIKEIIEKYLDSWDECYFCNHMFKVRELSGDNEDKPICKDCRAY